MECGVSECDREASTLWKLRLTRGGQTIKRGWGCLVYVVYSCLFDTHANNFMF